MRNPGLTSSWWRNATGTHGGVLAVVCLTSIALTGCATVGPRTITGDRFHYNKAGAQSAREQMLLNIVRLRYGEPIYWLEIGQMLSSYTFKAGTTIGGFENDISGLNNEVVRSLIGGDSELESSNSWSAELSWSDRPTITYSPLEGEAFARRILSPIPASTIVYLTQSGWSIDRVFECCVQVMNGLQNEPIHDVSLGSWMWANKFRAVTTILKKFQDTGKLTSFMNLDIGTQAAYQYTPDLENASEAELADVLELKALLQLPGDNTRIVLTDRSVNRSTNELVVQPRSLFGTMYAMAQHMAPPREHVEDGQVGSASDDADDDIQDDNAWLKIMHGRSWPRDAFVRVYYNGYWFYISKSDWRSKRTFALLTYLFSLQATDSKTILPVVTVPAGG